MQQFNWLVISPPLPAVLMFLVYITFQFQEERWIIGYYRDTTLPAERITERQEDNEM